MEESECKGRKEKGGGGKEEAPNMHTAAMEVLHFTFAKANTSAYDPQTK